MLTALLLFANRGVLGFSGGGGGGGSSGGGGGCTHDEDCNLNGVCDPTAAACKCAPEWTGPTCGLLKLAPAKPRPLSGLDESLNSSWGGSIVEHNGVWHMFAARVVGHCGLDTWENNSEIIRATASDPEGPYTWAETLMPVFSHGPKVRMLPGGGFVMMHLGCGTPIYPETTGCTNGTTPAHGHNPHTPPVVCNQFNVSVTTADTPLGPWAPDRHVFLSTGSQAAGPSWYVTGGRAFSNPSPHMLPNGSLLCAFRADARDEIGGGESVSVATAASIYGPYVDTRGRPAVANPSHTQQEDPFLWQDERGHWHVLMHNMGPSGVGSHAFSRDAVSWTRSAVPPYNTTVAFTDGTVSTMQRRERPELVLSPLGQPRYFSSAVENGPGDHSYTLVMRVDA